MLPKLQFKEVAMQRINGATAAPDRDFLAAEVPLEIRVEDRNVAVVMRTPGEDRELAAGFLVSEGLVRKPTEIKEIRHLPHCLPLANGAKPSVLEAMEGNVVSVRLAKPEKFDLSRLTRHLFTSSSCGVCSKASIEAVRMQFPAIAGRSRVSHEVLRELPGRLAEAQETFKRTGGLHACALFDLKGNLLAVREDVGRHNALDKVIGWALLENRLPLRKHILLLSGRASFEMMQKALAAGVPMVAAISAPSSLAVEFARESGQTLVGFLRGEKMNVYAGAERVNQ
jgi:FdhD protein